MKMVRRSKPKAVPKRLRDCKILLFVFIIALTSGQAWAQVVIPASRFPTALGDSFVSFTNRNAVTVSFDPGANSWDFSSGPQSDTAVMTSIPRARAPQPDSFSQAQLFIKDFLLRDTAATYFYGGKTTDSLYIYGVSVPDTPPGRYLILRFLPDRKGYPFPLQAGVSWTAIDSIPLGTRSGFRLVMFDTSYGRVLKEGTVTAPIGGPSPCLLTRVSRRGLLRLRPINIILDTVYQETAEWLVPDWGVAVTIYSSESDSSWPITQAVGGGFSRLWKLIHVGVEEQPPHPSRLTLYELGPAFPNPMRDQTVIPFYPASDIRHPLSLAIYDAVGRLVCVLTSHQSRVASHSFVWDGRDDAGQPVGSGVYFYRLEAGSFSATQKLVVVR
jgi:hypothetical protein